MSPSVRSTAPAACADAAASSGASKARAISDNSAEAARAAARSSSGQQNLDRGRQHPGATDSFPCIEENAPDRGRRRVDLTLRQTEQRQSWLRLPSALVRTRVTLFRLGEVASKSIDPAAPIERRSRRRPRDQEITRALCVARGLAPLAPQLQDFGAVEQTLAAIAHEIGLRRAPLRKRGRPFIRAPQVERLSTAFQYAAVDIAGHEWGSPHLRSPTPSLHRIARHLRQCVRGGGARDHVRGRPPTPDRDRQSGERSPLPG